MRKLTLALAVGLLVAGTGMAASPRGVAASAPAYVTKVVIVVGQVQGTTQQYIADADQAATEFQAAAASAGRSVSITKIYSPNATWGAVHAAAKGANILVYLGHGNGYPNPYVSYEQPLKDNGMGLNNVAGTSSSTTYYYGEAYMAQLQLAPNAIVILNHLCYASGNSESGYANPTLAVAKTRVDGYGSGFIRGGASAVIAEGTRDIGYFINALFNGHMTVDAMWKGDPSFNGNVISYASSRSAGYTSELDPNVANPPTGGGGPEVYYRSMVSIPTTTTDAIISGQTTPFVSQSGSFYKVSPVVRLVDTRSASIGPLGRLTSGGEYTFQITGKQVGGVTPVPPYAIAITANLTITNQTAPGWLYLGPTVDSAPVSSTINFPKGDNRANGVTVALSPQGTVGAWYGAAGGATIDLIIDVTGYFLAGGSGDGYVAYGPKRVMDTRPNSGIPGPSGVFPAGQHRTIPIAGVAGLPETGIVAVAGNLIVVGPTAAGYVTLGPDPIDKPPTSTINFPRGDTRANNVVVPLNADGTLSAVYVTTTAGATVNLVLDISGYFVAGDGALLNTMQPVRMLDSRPTTNVITNVGLTGPFSSNTAKTLQVTGTGVVPTGAVAITANLTVTEQTAAGFAALGPTINASTNFSNLNFPAGDNRANGATVPLLTPGGSLQLIYGAAGSGCTAQLILDVTGYYMPPV
jgi:hypothetical protein